MFNAHAWVMSGDMASFPAATVLHEIGHNLGLLHADLYGDDLDKQGDTSSLM